MKVAKFVVAFLTAAGIAAGAALTDDAITRSEWIIIGIAALGAVGVYLVPNKPATPTA
jgi:uncharacterized membrane protein YccC